MRYEVELNNAADFEQAIARLDRLKRAYISERCSDIASGSGWEMKTFEADKMLSIIFMRGERYHFTLGINSDEEIEEIRRILREE